jgi:hypothetical protein
MQHVHKETKESTIRCSQEAYISYKILNIFLKISYISEKKRNNTNVIFNWRTNGRDYINKWILS